MENFSLAKLKFLGYTRSFFYDKDDELSFDDYTLVDIDKKTFLDILNLKINLFNLLTDENSIVFYKILDDISISKEFILEVFNLIIKENISFNQVIKYLDIFFDENLMFTNHIIEIRNFNKKNDDYFFENEANLIICSLKYLYDEMIEIDYIKLISEQIEIINELSDKKNSEFSNITTKFILYFLSLKSDYIEENNQVSKYFLSSLLKIKQDYPFFAYETLATEYFFASKLTKKDYKKALFYALKAFKIYKSPAMANIIGRTLILLNKKNEKEIYNDCFKYIAYSYLNNKNFIAGYLLADCYRYGVGTFNSTEVALNILKECSEARFRDFLLTGNFDNGYLDILLRLIKINFYDLKMKLDDALLKSYFLQLREIIKTRYHISNSDKDFNILKLLNDILFDNLDLSIIRIIKNNGYDVTKYLNSFSLSHIEGKIQSEENYLTLELSPKENQLLYIEFKDIAFGEFTKKAKFIIEYKNDNKIDDQVINEFNSSLNNVIFSNGTIFLLYKEEVIDLTNVNIYYVPSKMVNISKLYNIGYVFIKNKRKYLYLSDEVEEGDFIKIKNKKYQIKKILHVYEDSLPFYLSDMHQYSNK